MREETSYQKAGEIDNRILLIISGKSIAKGILLNIFGVSSSDRVSC